MQNERYAKEIREGILYEDREIIVCRKPAGIAVQNRSGRSMDMENILKNYLAEKTGSRQERIPALFVVHRLDQPVEGVLVFAKTRKAAADLGRQVQNGEMKKEYLAFTTAEVREDSGELRDVLLRDGRTNLSRVVPAGTPGAKEAGLFYKVKKRGITAAGSTGTLLEIVLNTGRHHQIRVQLGSAGMPILGDRKYGTQGETADQLCLASWRLSFRHPASGRTMNFEASPSFLQNCDF